MLTPSGAFAYLMTGRSSTLPPSPPLVLSEIRKVHLPQTAIRKCRDCAALWVPQTGWTDRNHCEPRLSLATSSERGEMDRHVCVHPKQALDVIPHPWREGASTTVTQRL